MTDSHNLIVEHFMTKNAHQSEGLGPNITPFLERQIIEYQIHPLPLKLIFMTENGNDFTLKYGQWVDLKFQSRWREQVMGATARV